MKYIEFDFVIGADGVRILLPKEFLKTKYLYYFLKWVNISSLGYSRHYKLLKELQVPIPPLPTQHQIVSELDALSDIITKKKQQLEALDQLAQATFYDMFGDPVNNEKGWEVKKLGEIGEWASGGTPSRTDKSYFEGDINWYSAGELNSLFLPKSNEKITEKAIKESSAKLFKINSLFIGMYDTAAFKMGITTRVASSNQACANVYPNQDVSIIWLYFLLQEMKEHFLKMRRGIRQQNLNLVMIKCFTIPIPPLPLQTQFASKIESIEQQKSLIKQSIVDVEQLFNFTMDKYFN